MKPRAERLYEIPVSKLLCDSPGPITDVRILGIPRSEFEPGVIEKRQPEIAVAAG
jgi:hypothetical protein